MDDIDALSQLRLRVGDPDLNVVTDGTLRMFYTSALERLAGEIGWLVPPPMPIALLENVYSYPLPDECLQVLSLHYGEDPMLQVVPDSVTRWIRDNLAWRESPSATPSRFAIQGRSLLLNPPPSQDTTDASNQLLLSFIAHSPDLGPQGVQGLPPADLYVAIYDAAREYCLMFPGTTPEAQARSQQLVAANQALYTQHLKQTHVRWNQPAKFASSSISPGGRRSWAAR